MNQTGFVTQYEQHRMIATQVEALYVEINKLATKKPAERLTPIIAKKINHSLNRVKEQVQNDEFLDAIETLPVDGELTRYDEALIVMAELRSALDRQWGSAPYFNHRSQHGRKGHTAGRMDDDQTF